MPIFVKVVPGEPYGKSPRFCVRIESGYRAGHLVEHAGSGVPSAPIRWSDPHEAERWARETGYSVLSTVLRRPAQLLVNLYETFHDFQFDDRAISGADLVDDLGRWLRKYKAAVARLAVDEADPGAQRLQHLLDTFSALHAGNSDVNGADLVDDLSEWLRETQALMHELTGAPFEAKVARNSEGAAYWSEETGWGELHDATAFFASIPAGLRSGEVAEWVVVPLAHELRTDVDAAAAPRG